MITNLQQKCNKIIWDGFDEEFYRAEEEFYVYKYHFAENVVSLLQRKVGKTAFEFGLGAGVVDTFFDIPRGIFVSENSERLVEIPYAQHVDKYNFPGKSLSGKLGEIVGWLNKHGHNEEAQAVAVCGGKTNAVDLRCLAEHRYAKQIFCGRQYCIRCGEEDSVIHQQRYSRSWDRLMWAPALGKIVLTVPEELRNNFKNIDMLGKLHRLGWKCAKEVWGRDIAKEDGEIEKGIDIDGAMTTAHFFGDENEGEDRFDKFHPHVNVTFPLETKSVLALIVSVERLKALRSKWYDMLEALTGKKISLMEDGCKRENAWYGFSTTDAHKAHWLKYAVRPTVGAERFRRLADDMKEFIVTSLVGFHNVRWFGKLSNRNFKKYKKDYLENALFYQEFLSKKSEKPRDFKYCPICHGRLKVHKHKGKVEILEGIHKTWHELSLGFWCDEVTYQILVRKGLVGADGKFSGSSP